MAAFLSQIKSAKLCNPLSELGEGHMDLLMTQTGLFNEKIKIMPVKGFKPSTLN